MEELNFIRVGFTVNLLFDAVGAILFFKLVYVIFKYRKLHDIPCLKFIGLYMLCCLCSKFIIILPYLIRVIPLQNVQLIVCICVQILPMSFSNAMPSINVGIAFDRMLSVFFPIWYCKKQKFYYSLVFFCCMAFIPIYMAYNMIKHLVENPFIQTNCTTMELYGTLDSLEGSWNYNYTIILFYAVIIAKFIWDGRTGMKEYFNRQPMFKSIAIVIGVQVFGWFASRYAYVYIPPLLFNNMNENQIPLIYYAINCFSSTIINLEFVALYFTSTEHRKALKKEFPLLFRQFLGANTLSNINSNNTYVQAIAALNIKAVGIGIHRRDSQRRYIPQ